MPADNPYAAPQTLESRLPAHLPSTAEPGVPSARRKFVDWDTVRLKSLWRDSCAIKDMQGIWLVNCLMVPIIAFFFSLSFALYDFYFDPTRGSIALCFVALTFTRFGTGFTRTSSGRVFALVMDGLLGLFCALVTMAFIVAAIAGHGFYILAMFFVPLIPMTAYYAVCSLRALWQAPELFGPRRLPHDALKEEVEFREQHGIE